MSYGSRRIALLPLLLFPFVAQADLSQPYNMLAPIFGVPSITSIGQYLDLIFKGLVGIAALLAVVMLVVCGIKMMTSEALTSKSESRECIKNAILGLLLALAAWIILNTINPELVKTQLGIIIPPAASTQALQKVAGAQAMPTDPGWYFQYKVISTGDTKFARAGAPTEGGGKCEQLMAMYEGEPDYQILTTTINGVQQKCFLIKTAGTIPNASEASMRNQICGVNDENGCIVPSPEPKGDGKVYINKRGCMDPLVLETGCTSVASLDGSAVQLTKGLAGQGYTVVITGGTERGHTYYGGSSDHYPGNATMDLRLGGDPGLDGYIKTNGLNKSGGSPASSGVLACPGGTQGTFCGNRRWYLNGFWFVEERYSDTPNKTVTPHWHVCKDGATGRRGNPSALTPWCNNP